MRIMSIDGALNHSGWSVFDTTDGEGWNSAELVSYGIILPKLNLSLAAKLLFNREQLIKLSKTHKPDVFVFEDTYAGVNAQTSARLNNAKGVLLVTCFEILKKEPACVKATEARACLGFKNGKDPKREPWEFFRELYSINASFEKGNDITDSCVLAWWYIYSNGKGCVERKKQKKVRGLIRK